MTEYREFTEIPIPEIQDPMLKPRWPGWEGDLHELAASIEELGLLQPITVTRVDGGYRLIAGNRRLHACRDLLGWDTIPAIVVEIGDREVEATVVENLQRLNLDPVEEAFMFASILEDQGKTQEEVARAIGKSRSYVAKRLMLLDLDPETLAEISKGTISWTHGLELKRVEDIERRHYLLELAVNHGVNVRVLRGWVDEELIGPPTTAEGPEALPEPAPLPPVQIEKLRCLLCGRDETQAIITFVPMCYPDKQELERLLQQGNAPAQEA